MVSGMRGMGSVWFRVGLTLEFDRGACLRFWAIEIVSGGRGRSARHRVVDRSRSLVVCTCTIFSRLAVRFGSG